MANCPHCQANTLLQSDPTTCHKCGGPLPIRSLKNTVVVETYPTPLSPDDQHKQLIATLRHMRDFHQTQGEDLTWELTATGANLFINGKPSGEARLEEQQKPEIHTVFELPEMKCPRCHAPLNAVLVIEEHRPVPTPGDMILCQACIAILAFTEQGGIRIMTKSETDRLSDEEREALATGIRNLRISKAAGIATNVEMR